MFRDMLFCYLLIVNNLIYNLLHYNKCYGI